MTATIKYSAASSAGLGLSQFSREAWAARCTSHLSTPSLIGYYKTRERLRHESLAQTLTLFIVTVTYLF